ncbi:MAG: bacillithiol biosynthesis deacetylase BshB1 [Calditrichia bacterium]
MSPEKTIDIIAFGAHPDDVELGCGGTLLKLKQQGYSTAIIDLTEGEMGSRGTVAQRYRESARAAEILQIDHRENLQIPDGGVRVTEEYLEKIVKVIRTYRPRLVFAPYHEDRHPDHVHSSRLISEACFFSGTAKKFPGLKPHRPNRVLYYMAKYEFDPSFVIDISDQFDTKLKALQAYESQFYNPDWPQEQTFISSRWFMDSVEFRARHFGWMAGVKYAEPFWIREKLALDDPIPVFSRQIM